MQISVVVPTYNRLYALKQSLQALLEQDFPLDEYEILIVDDGSTDGTRDFLQEIVGIAPVKCQYHFQDHAGPAKARNWGIRKAQGKYIAFTDDDCIAPRNWLSKIAEAFKRYPGVVGVSGYMEADENILKNNIYAQFEKYANMGDYMKNQQEEHVGGKDFLGGATNNVAYQRKVLLEVEGFDETFPFAASEDADLKKRIVDRGYKMLHIPVKVTHRHPYSFKRLIRQAYVRGVGSRHFNQKHNLPSSSSRFLLSAIKIILRSFKLLFTVRYLLVPLTMFYQFNFMRGVMNYLKVVQGDVS